MESGFVCVEAREKVQEGMARRAMHTRLLKEPKKKIKMGKKEIGWADNLSARFPPLASASEGGAFFYTPTSTRITPRSHLGIMPPGSRDSHPVLAILGISVRSCAPLGPPYPAGLALALPRERWGFPLSQPHKY